MSGKGGGGGAATSASGGSMGATQQANDMTRNFILGIPKEGLDPNSEEARDLRAAEAFVGDIQQEILAYDIANAKAVEAYARLWWSRVPFFGRHAKQAIAEEAAAEARERLQQQQQRGAAGAAAAAAAGAGAVNLDMAAARAAVEAEAGTGTYLHTQSGTDARGMRVERTSALDKQALAGLAGGKGSGPVYSTNTAKVNTWLFKKNHPGWVPLIQRWWVPWVCVVAIGLVWTPDVWKLRTLYMLDYQYANLRRAVHRAYWRVTMSKEDYEKLMADIEAQRPPSVKGTDCPF